MKPDEALLLQKANENLEAAQLLVDQGFLSIAASRAYYAMFYLAEALLLRKGLHFSSHAAVIASYGKAFAKTGELDPQFHQYLIKAQAIRQISDYGYNEPITAESVLEIIGWGKEFYQAAASFLK